MRSFSKLWVTLVFITCAIPAFAQPRRVQAESQPLTPEALSFLSSLPVQSDACTIAGNLSCGMSVLGYANACNDGDYHVDFWLFNGVAGQPITATITNASALHDVMAAIQNYGSGGEILKSTYARGGLTLTFTPTITKQYSVTVGYLAKYYSRSYNLRFTCGNGDTGSTSCRPSGTLVRGATVSGSLSANNGCNGSSSYWALYEFEGEEGVPVRIETAATFPLYMEANTVDSSTGTYKLSDILDQSFVFYPEYSGLQELWISHEGAKVSGQFTVKLTDEPLAPCRRRAVGR